MEDRVSLWGRVRESCDGDGQGLVDEGPTATERGGGSQLSKDPTVLAPTASQFHNLGSLWRLWGRIRTSEHFASSPSREMEKGRAVWIHT